MMRRGLRALFGSSLIVCKYFVRERSPFIPKLHLPTSVLSKSDVLGLEPTLLVCLNPTIRTFDVVFFTDTGAKKAASLSSANVRVHYFIPQFEERVLQQPCLTSHFFLCRQVSRREVSK